MFGQACWQSIRAGRLGAVFVQARDFERKSNFRSPRNFESQKNFTSQPSFPVKIWGNRRALKVLLFCPHFGDGPPQKLKCYLGPVRPRRTGRFLRRSRQKEEYVVPQAEIARIAPCSEKLPATYRYRRLNVVAAFWGGYVGRSRAKKVIAAGAFAHPWATVQGLVNAPRRRAFFAAVVGTRKD